MVPAAIVDPSLCGLDLDGPRAHVQQQVKLSVQQLHGKEVHLSVLGAPGFLPVLWFTVGEEDQPVGFGGAEVEGDGAHPFGVPLGQGQVRIRRLKVDGVQRRNIFTLEGNVPLQFHLRVDDASQAGQLQTDVIVLVHHL